MTEPTKAKAFGRWWAALCSPHMPGMDSTSPRARPVAIALILSLLALQVVARYRWGFLPGKEWQLLHLTIGLMVCFGVMCMFHGRGILARVRSRTWTLLAVGMLLFCLFWYFGRVDSYGKFFGVDRPETSSSIGMLRSFFYFSACSLLLRTIVPLGFARWTYGLKPGALGWSTRGNAAPAAVTRIWPIYLFLFVLMLPFLFAASQTSSFQKKYPLARKIIEPATLYAQAETRAGESLEAEVSLGTKVLGKTGEAIPLRASNGRVRLRGLDGSWSAVVRVDQLSATALTELKVKRRAASMHAMASDRDELAISVRLDLQPAGRIPLWPYLAYALAYALLFVSGEGFWRGFLVFSGERDLGLYVLPIMVVPYVTGHFGKPLSETLGAIAAGLILGWLALKHRSIWLGVALHVTVAMTMDLLSIDANGYWFAV